MVKKGEKEKNMLKNVGASGLIDSDRSQDNMWTKPRLPLFCIESLRIKPFEYAVVHLHRDDLKD